MKNILKYAVVAGMALASVSCAQDALVQNSGEEGSVTFDISLSSAITKAPTESDATQVRIYKSSGDLVRYYEHSYDVPSPLYLVAGSYSVRVNRGDKKNNKAFVDPDDAAKLAKLLCYEGTSDFTVEAHKTNAVNVTAKTLNVRADMTLDPTKGQNANLQNVSMDIVAMNVDTVPTTMEEYNDAVTDNNGHSINFTQTGRAYFLLGKDVTKLVWHFSATHPDCGTIEKFGIISDVKSAYGYAVNFVYSKTPDGYGSIDVNVITDVDTYESEFKFKPEPEISGEGITTTGVNKYVGGSTVNLVCESINDLVVISLGGKDIYAFSAGTTAVTGVTCTKVSSTKVNITMTEAYFNTLSTGINQLSFTITDTNGEYSQKLKFAKQGLVDSSATFDLWANTAVLKAVVTSSAAQVQIRYRRQGTSDWAYADAAIEADGITYSAATTAVWNDAEQNADGQTVYTPNVDKSFFAGSSYEYQLVLDGTAKESSVITTPAGQTIPYATFEDSSLKCFSNDDGTAPYWGSGNNSFATSLCSQGSMAGQEGSHCAKLSATAAGAVGITMLAAGNVFLGTFSKPGTTGTVKFGISYAWTARPSSLKYKYWGQIGNVDRTDKSSYVVIAKGQPDQGSVYAVIVDWDTQHGTSSGTGNPSGVWSPTAGPDAVSEGKIIGYALVNPTGTTSGSSMVEQDIKFYYYDKVSKPSKKYTLVIMASTSRYGDYMNGCSTSVMYVDDFRFGY